MGSARGFGRSQRSSTDLELGVRLAPYVRTLPVVIEAMLQLGQVSPSDWVYDLGCGDGRIVIRAAEGYGARGLGVDLDRERIREARQGARARGVADRVQFKSMDLMQLDLAPATVVTLYLLPDTQLQIRDKLRRELKPGAKILSHSFDLGDWTPTATTQVSDVINTYSIYLWQV